MERRIERLENRLRAISGALRLRGVWSESVAEEPVSPDAPSAQQVLRLRGGTRVPGGD